VSPGTSIKHRNSALKVTRKGPLSAELKSGILAALPLVGSTRITPLPRVRGAFFGAQEQGFVRVRLHIGMRLFASRDGSYAGYAHSFP